MYEPNPEAFDLRFVQTVVTRSVFNAFPMDGKGRPLTKEEADALLVKILTTFYYTNYLTFACALLGFTQEDMDRVKSLESLIHLVKEIDMSFVYINVLVAEYFSPILLAE